MQQKSGISLPRYVARNFRAGTITYIQSRRHGGAFGVLAPQKKLQAPQIET